MGARLWLCCLVFPLFITACVTRDEAMHEQGIQPEEGSNIPAASPGPGIEKIRVQPDSTPTPTPHTPMDRPLDPAGLPQG
ncbi:MAG TPA: hypothetical protein VGM62_18795 [Chthoniobacterales bacterium]